MTKDTEDKEIGSLLGDFYFITDILNDYEQLTEEEKTSIASRLLDVFCNILKEIIINVRTDMNEKLQSVKDRLRKVVAMAKISLSNYE